MLNDFPLYQAIAAMSFQKCICIHISLTCSSESWGNHVLTIG